MQQPGGFHPGNLVFDLMILLEKYGRIIFPANTEGKAFFYLQFGNLWYDKEDNSYQKGEGIYVCKRSKKGQFGLPRLCKQR